MGSKFDPNFRIVLIAAITSFVVAVIATAGLFVYLLSQNEGAAALSLPPFVSGASEEESVVSAVKKANPAVVSIAVTRRVPVTDRRSSPNPFDFFGFSLPLPQSGPTQKQETGGGSGFLVSQDGHIVTNRHVVDDLEAEYTVFTNDGAKHPAKVIAQDPTLDLAVIKIGGSGYPFLAFGDSGKLEVGQTAIAIGNALGEFRNTVSVGVISGLARSIIAGDARGQEVESLNQVIQTDAAINSGNSGGPLLNLSGEVVGINVAMAVGSENIGFALPANEIKGVVTTVLAGGKIVRPYLGVRYLSVNSALKIKNNLPFDYGALVTGGPENPAVVPGSPADKAGILENDLILEVDGAKITESNPLSAIIRRKQVGEVLSLKIWHNGTMKDLKVTLSKIQ